MIAESQTILGRQIHNAEIPRGSTCLLIQTRTHTFYSQAHAQRHTQYVGLVEAVAVRFRAGPLLGWRSLFYFHGLCFPLMMGPLSVLPVDLHYSDLVIKHAFTKPKQEKEEGERGEKRQWWKGKGDGKAKFREEQRGLKAGKKGLL